MKPITKGKISSKLAPDSSHLSALDLHSWEGEGLCFDPGNKDRIGSVGREGKDYSSYLQPSYPEFNN